MSCLAGAAWRGSPLPATPMTRARCAERSSRSAGGRWRMGWPGCRATGTRAGGGDLDLGPLTPPSPPSRIHTLKRTCTQSRSQAPSPHSPPPPPTHTRVCAPAQGGGWSSGGHPRGCSRGSRAACCCRGGCGQGGRRAGRAAHSGEGVCARVCIGEPAGEGGRQFRALSSPAWRYWLRASTLDAPPPHLCCLLRTVRRPSSAHGGRPGL